MTIMYIKRKTGIFSSNTCRFEYLINLYHIWSGKVTSEWKKILKDYVTGLPAKQHMLLISDLRCSEETASFFNVFTEDVRCHSLSRTSIPEYMVIVYNTRL